MKTSPLIIIAVGLVCGQLFAQPTNSVTIYPNEGSTNPADQMLVWSATPGLRYQVEQTTNLTNWATAPGYPATANGPAQAMPFSMTNRAQFFRIAELDEQPPVIVSQYPMAGGFAVPRFSDITMLLSDATGINTNSIQFTVGSLGTFTLNPTNLTYTNGVLTFINGGSVPLGGWGSKITATLLVADTLGYWSTNTWSFDLEVQPQVVTNLFVFGSSQALRSGQQLRPSPTVALAMRDGPVPMGSGDPWLLELVETNRLELSYTNTAPAFTVGRYISNKTPVTTNEIFYREVTSISDNPGTKRLTLFTVDVPLAEILETGSKSLSQESVIYQLSNNVIVRAFAYPLKRIVFDPIGVNTNDAVLYDQDGVTLTLKEAKFEFTPALELSFETKDLLLQRFTASLNGRLETALVPELHIEGALSDDFDFDLYQHKLLVYVGQAGPVPIWLDFNFSVTAQVGYELAADATLTTGIRKNVDMGFGVEYVKGRSPALQPLSGNPYVNPEPTQIVPFIFEVNGSASAYATIIPQLDVRINSLAGVYANVDPRVDVSGSATFSGGQLTTANLCVSADADLNVGLSILGLDNFELDSFKLFDIPWCTNYPAPGTLTILTQPQPLSQSVLVGSSANFWVRAAGQSLTYQWYDNQGTLMPGKTEATLTLYNINLGHQGAYRVKISGGGQSLWSDFAYLSAYTANTPSGMALIPAGSFTMGDTFSEADINERPLHSVYVSAFYMDRYEVSKALWDDVYNWAITHGYSFNTSGLGKAPHHPVHSINWYDMVKWCNARSEKEGRTPAYYTGAGQTTVYRTGQVNVPNDWVKWSVGGYRLPTEVEWEKAARGGSSGHRFPWGNTISWSQANYYAYPLGYPYDVNATSGYHPAFADGASPNTSPPWYFSPNGYGLYNMAGNVWEWCWDWYNQTWYANALATQANTHGPSETLSYRVVRGGSWSGLPYELRCAHRDFGEPAFAFFTIGFRCVRGL